MKQKIVLAVLLAAVLGFISGFSVIAAEKKGKASGTIHDILKQHVGQLVELRLTSGNAFKGKIEKITGHAVYLSGLDGDKTQEAIIRAEKVFAIIKPR